MLKHKGIYWALISTFILLYLAVAFVSTLHAITFFQIANTLWLAILLGAAYEVGQATVLFSIIMTENKNKMLAWLMMLLLTTLQVTANVYASFMYMDTTSGTDWQYWQRSVLFWMEGQTPEMYKIIISWISGALLPLVALGMTALVAENVQMATKGELEDDEDEKKKEKEEDDDEPGIIDRGLNNLVDKIRRKKKVEGEPDTKEETKEEKKSGVELDRKLRELEQQLARYKERDEPAEANDDEATDNEATTEYMIGPEEKAKSEPMVEPEAEGSGKDTTEAPEPKSEPKRPKKKQPTTSKKPKKKKVKPVNRPRGWHAKKRFVDDAGNVFEKGKYIGTEETGPSKKA